MKLQHRIGILKELGDYMGSEDPAWHEIKARASRENSWFLPQFIDIAVEQIRKNFLHPALLQQWIEKYHIPETNEHPLTVGVVMAGNIPLVGFHDFLCVFVSGHRQKIKLSSKDQFLLKHLIQKIISEYPEAGDYIMISDMLKNCDAYIATGSDNSSRYFVQYFGKYPNIIRKNRTSVAVLDGSETKEELDRLADDIQLYFGLGCRNVTQLFVPEQYDFVPLLEALKKYSYFTDEHKYKHNYDYNLAIPIINNQFYMTNGSVLLVENPSPFSPIGQLHYQFYNDRNKLTASLDRTQIQCIVGKDNVPFGSAQQPSLTDYADGVDTMDFLMNLGAT